MFQLHTSFAFRESLETASGGDPFDYSVQFLPRKTIFQSSLSRIQPVNETNLTAVSDTPLPVKPPRVFQSRSSSVSGPSSGHTSRVATADQLQQRTVSMRIKERRHNDAIFSAQNKF